MTLNLQQLNIKPKNIVLSISAIIGISVIIRMYFYPFDLPITHDGDNYFSYALDTVLLGHLPETYTLPNNGWPMLLSLLFSMFHFDSALEYMSLQRILSIAISSATAIPVYFLCRRFFAPIFSILGSGFFVLAPRITENSLLGITEPLFICLITTSLFCFLSNNRKIVYYSFWILALASIIRYEGIILLIPFSIIFFVKFKNKRKTIPRYFFIIAIFVLILLPVAYLRTETIGSDGFTNVLRGPQFVVNSVSTDEPEKIPDRNILDFISSGASGLTKYISWSLIPFFLLFVPFGIVMLFKNMEHKKGTIIITALFLMIPAFYAYSREFQEIRYVFVLYPIFSLISLYTIEFISKKIKNIKIIILIIFCGLIFASITFLDYNLPNYEHEREVLVIQDYIWDNTNVVNWYYPGTEYLNFIQYEKMDNFPVLMYETKNATPPKIYFAFKDDSEELLEFDTVNEFLIFAKASNLSHIVTDGNNANPVVLNRIFFNEKDYPYLVKEYDSLEKGFQYHVKIFKIDYGVLERGL